MRPTICLLATHVDESALFAARRRPSRGRRPVCERCLRSPQWSRPI